MTSKINIETLSRNASDAIASTDFEKIDAALIAWAFEGCDYDAANHGEALDNAVRTLEQTNCSGCSAPSGLIYNSDLAVKLGEWAFEIDAALDEYRDNMGESYKPESVFSLVWFAVEYRAHDLASLFESERESIIEGLDSKWAAGFNMPGYMPDSDPVECDTWEEARDYLKEEIERAADQVCTSIEAGEAEESADFEQRADAAIAALDALEEGAEFGQTIGAYHYWMTRQ